MSKQSGSQCERASEQTNKQSSKTTQNKPVSSLGWQPESATSIPMNHSGARPSPSFLSRSQPVRPPGWLTVLFARRRRLAPATQAKLKAHIAESDRSLLARSDAAGASALLGPPTGGWPFAAMRPSDGPACAIGSSGRSHNMLAGNDTAAPVSESARPFTCPSPRDSSRLKAKRTEGRETTKSLPSPWPTVALVECEPRLLCANKEVGRAFVGTC